tara:strand:+ start:1470 stop:1709 length:240 start_codon:yes stop_codon:yes gene_type:complete
VQTHADLRIGTLVRWHGGSDPDAAEDIDELGIVVEMAGANSRSGSGNYHIAWSTSNTVSHHSPEMIEESLYQGQMEIMR